MHEMIGKVFSVSKKGTHEFSKEIQEKIELITMHGVEGDAHAGKYVKHRSRVKKDPTQLNIRQVHLIASELFEELYQYGYSVKPGDLGENITTKGIDLINSPKYTQLKIGASVVLEVTGLRNPCRQIEDFGSGLLKKMISKDAQGNLVRKTGIMTIVKFGGFVSVSDNIEVCLPKKPFVNLDIV